MTSPQTVPYETFQREREKRLAAEQDRDDFKQKYYSILDEKRWEKKWDALPSSSTKLQRIDKDLIKQLVRTDKFGQHRDQKGRVRINFTTYAKNLGVSDDTITRRFERLTTSNLISDALSVEEGEGPRWYVRINKELIQEADHEKISFPEETPKQGGDRYTCQKCGSKHVKIKRTIKRTLVCLNPTCKHEVALDDITDEYTLPPKHAQRAEDVKATCFSPPESNLQDRRNPDTPPQVAPDPDPELEQQAVHLLQELATGPTHIQMNTDPEKDKYLTINHPLWHSDALRHLRGIRTKGAVGRPLEGQTRGNCFDGDNAEEWQLCKDAALILAAVGFKPLLLPSPTQDDKHKGGGHLWIIFDQNVDAYSAQQTIYHHAPQLKSIKDFWPGGGINIRLPGSKYRCPDFEVWMNLYSEDGEELSRDGQNLADVLLDRQTPADLITTYEKPAADPKPEIQRAPTGAGGVLGKDFAKQYISEFNAMRDWHDIAAMAGGFTRGKFLAVWRGDRTPNVAVDPKTDLAKDFAQPDEPAMDKYDVWCKIMAHRVGQDWQLFKKHDLAQRCAYRRQQMEQIAS